MWTKVIYSGSALMAGLVLLGMAHAADSKPAHAERFSGTGEIGRVDLERRGLVVDDMLYGVLDYASVYDLSGSLTTLGALRPGMEVGYHLRSEQRRAPIDAVWILPSGSIQR